MELVKSRPWVVGPNNILQPYQSWQLTENEAPAWCSLRILTTGGVKSVDLTDLLDSDCIFDVQWDANTRNDKYQHTYETAGQKTITINFANSLFDFYMNGVDWVSSMVFLDFMNFDHNIEIRRCSNLFLIAVETDFGPNTGFLAGETAIESPPVMNNFYGKHLFLSHNAKLNRGDRLVRNAPNLTHINNILTGSSIEVAATSLFNNMPNVRSASGVFMGNTKIWYAQDDIFKSNFKELTDLSWCFAGCTNLSNAPKLWLQYPDADGEGCYAGCTKLPWYNEIPDYWKTPMPT